jgi:endonuclease YncB( thermonuclease family)
VLLPDGTNVNHTLVKDGMCWWYRKYAPGDTVLKEAGEGVRHRSLDHKQEGHRFRWPSFFTPTSRLGYGL